MLVKNNENGIKVLPWAQNRLWHGLGDIKWMHFDLQKKMYCQESDMYSIGEHLKTNKQEKNNVLIHQ